MPQGAPKLPGCLGSLGGALTGSKRGAQVDFAVQACATRHKRFPCHSGTMLDRALPGCEPGAGVAHLGGVTTGHNF